MEFRCLHITVLMSVFEACVSYKNNTTIYICVGENVTLSCPTAGVNKTVSWFRRNVSKNPIKTLYGGTKGKGNNLEPRTMVNVDKDKGEFNLTIMNLTKADNGTYQCLHDKNFTSWLFHVLMKDCIIKINDSEPIRTDIPHCSGSVVEGILTKDNIIFAVIVVLVVLVLIIVSLICHAFIRLQFQQTNAPVTQTDVVRHSPFQIEMQKVFNDEEDVHEESRNLHLLSEILQDLQNASSDDKKSDLSKTNTSQSSSLSNRSQNINEEDYLHPYHSFVHSGLDVHEYDTVDVQESTEYEEIPGIFLKNKS